VSYIYSSNIFFKSLCPDVNYKELWNKMNLHHVT
jgi:hypothetical protein